jgi:hypothetical protein
MNKEILLLGCNYSHIDYRNINYTTTITKIARYFKKNEIAYNEITNINDTNYNSILLALYKVALKSWVSKLNTVLIYYTGDSIDIAEYISGYNSNYNINQGIVPTDYNIRKGVSVIKSEVIFEILNSFNPLTKIIFIADTCFTKSNILNLKYDWNINNKELKMNNYLKYNDTLNNIIFISYCLDILKSEDDNFYNILEINKKMISLGDYIIKLRNLLDNDLEIKNNYDIFNILKDINGIIKNKKINMNVSMSSSYNILNKREYLSVLDKYEETINIESFQDYVDKSYIEIEDNYKEPIFIDIPLVTTDNDNISVSKVIKAPKAAIVPKLPIHSINQSAPVLIDPLYTNIRSSNDNYDFNRCSHSSFNETPRFEQFTPRQSNSFIETPRVIYSEYQQPIQQFHHIPLVQYVPIVNQQVNQQYKKTYNYYQQPQQYQYYNTNTQIQQKYILQSTIVSKDNNNYYKPSNTYINECFC